MELVRIADKVAIYEKRTEAKEKVANAAKSYNQRMRDRD
jgi:hypothetical protein